MGLSETPTLRSILVAANRERLRSAEKLLDAELGECPPFARALRLSVTPALATPEEALHMRTCDHCVRLAEVAREVEHPSRLALVRRAIAEVSPENDTLGVHLLACRTCAEFSGSRFVRRLGDAARTGRATLGDMMALARQALSVRVEPHPIGVASFATEDTVEKLWRVDVECGDVRILVMEAPRNRVELRATTRNSAHAGEVGYVVVTGLGNEAIEASIKFIDGIEEGELEGRAIVEQPAGWCRSNECVLDFIVITSVFAELLDGTDESVS